MRIIIKILVVALALLLVSELVPGVSIENFWIAVLASLVLGVLNILVRPILVVLTLPITILTLGLFIFILNALLFWFVAGFVEGFSVDGFVPALLGSLLVSVVSWVAARLIP